MFASACCACVRSIPMHNAMLDGELALPGTLQAARRTAPANGTRAAVPCFVFRTAPSPMVRLACRTGTHRPPGRQPFHKHATQATKGKEIPVNTPPPVLLRVLQHRLCLFASTQCSGLILTAHNFGSGNSDSRTFSRISGQILGENPLENPDSVRILPKKILTGSQKGRQNHDNPEDRCTASTFAISHWHQAVTHVPVGWIGRSTSRGMT